MVKRRERAEKPIQYSDPLASGSESAFPVVGIGASAGGLEAFQIFFTNMPPDTGVAFVLVQHLDPDHETMMPELLARWTSMPVELVKDETPIAPDHVYFIPPNTTLTVDQGKLRVNAPTEPRGHRTPIDSFFRSLAEDQGSNAICIVLSGSGSDGTIGLKAVKELGGMAIAQQPESAKFDSMPNHAILTGLVDYVLPVEEIPAKLVEYVRFMGQIDRGKDLEVDHDGPSDHIASIASILLQKTGHDFSRYKRTTLTRRIERRMRVVQADSAKAYVKLLEDQPKEAAHLFGDLLIGVTQFFRDESAFQVVEKLAIPELVRGKREADEIRVWVTACSTGEESYSMAILICEHLERLGSPHPRVKIFATDIDQRALDLARQGCYPEGIADQISPDRLEKYFDKQKNFYQVKKSIREMCIFSQHDLIRDPPFSRLDLISCRNLLIYLQPDVQKKLLSFFHYSLRPEGLLFLGPSENAAAHSSLFRAVDGRNRLYRRNEVAVRPFLGLPLANASSTPNNKKTDNPQISMGNEEVATKYIERTLLEAYAPPCVVVTESGDIVYFSGRTERYLSHPLGAPDVNAVRMARGSLRLDLRTALHKAIKSGEEIVHSNLSVDMGDSLQRINLVVRPDTELDGGTPLYVVVFQELGPAAEKNGSAAGPQSDQERKLVEDLEDELRTAKENLQATVEELETSNEELRSSNEELLSMNEELQSTNEELQTSKEELQSMNEEMESVNAELRIKIQELDKANSDLENLFASTDLATIFLDSEMSLRSYTPAATRVFRLKEGDIGRPITDIKSMFVADELHDDVRDALATTESKEREVHDGDRDEWYLMRVLPYRRLDGQYDGVVVTFADVSDQKAVQERIIELNRDLKRRYETLNALLETIPVGIAISHDPKCETIITNAAASEMLQIAPGSNASKTSDDGNPLPFRVLDKDSELRDEDLPMQRAAATGKPISDIELDVVRADGTTIKLLEYAVPLFDEDGTTRGCVGVFIDITDRKAMEDALKAAGRQKDEFLAMLSHELRNPLAPLTTALHIFEKNNPDLTTSGELRGVMSRQINHLVRLVDDLLDVSRISQGKIVLRKEDVDLGEILRDTVADFAGVFETAGINLNVAMTEDELPLKGDRTRLSQMFGNVLRNAAKFTARDGSVDIKLSRENGSAVITISDTGIGIKASQLEQVFNIFGQLDRSLDRSRGGLGLGLYLVRRIAELHGGNVEAKSGGENQGSEFILRLPLDGEKAETAKRSGAKIIRSGQTPLKVLIIEDNNDSADVLRLMLKYEGHTVEVAADGQAGIEKAGEFRPDVILCDIGLPGMDGYQVAESIRADAELKSIHLVALTGYGRPEDRRKAEKAGFDEHLTKPASPASVNRLLAKWSDGDGS